MTTHEQHRIYLFRDQPQHSGQTECWCAAHWYDGVFDESGPLPPEAQADPEGYCDSQWPEAEITRS